MLQRSLAASRNIECRPLLAMPWLAFEGSCCIMLLITYNIDGYATSGYFGKHLQAPGMPLPPLDSRPQPLNQRQGEPCQLYENISGPPKQVATTAPSVPTYQPNIKRLPFDYGGKQADHHGSAMEMVACAAIERLAFGLHGDGAQSIQTTGQERDCKVVQAPDRSIDCKSIICSHKDMQRLTWVITKCL